MNMGLSVVKSTQPMNIQGFAIIIMMSVGILFTTFFTWLSGLFCYFASNKKHTMRSMLDFIFRFFTPALTCDFFSIRSIISSLSNSSFT